MNYRNMLIIKRLVIFGIIITSSILGLSIYQQESSVELKGTSEVQLTYRFSLQNMGPHNLTYVSIRLALLKTWDPVQVVNSLELSTPANYTTIDEYDNKFAWYVFNSSFLVGQSINLTFKANITLNLLDYTTVKLDIQPYDKTSKDYLMGMEYDPLENQYDPAIQQLSNILKEQSESTLDYIYRAYNFSSTYIKYKLLTNARGASFALLNGYGDCDEYTKLLVALLRANNIPAVDQTAWLADFTTGFETTDQGAAAHLYPLVFLEGVGYVPLDPTRGNSNLFDNFLKSDEKRITLTRGPDHPYRRLNYKWKVIPDVPDPLIVSNYTIKIDSMNTQYDSILRTTIIGSLVFIPVLFIGITVLISYKDKKEKEMKLKKMISPYED